MDGMEATNESLLSGGVYSLYISAAIVQHHLHKSIFRLLRIILKFVIKKNRDYFFFIFRYTPLLSFSMRPDFFQ